MKHSHLIHRVDRARILEAIHAADAKTTGHVRVMISKRGYRHPLAAAERHFKVLKLHKTPQRNAVLIFMAPKSRTFAIYGDTAVHAHCGPEFWNILRDEMSLHLKDSRYTDALVHAITKAGDLLAMHFPQDTGDSTTDTTRGTPS
jgi:uncharacterized membrane protein